MVSLVSLYEPAIEIENLIKGFDEIEKMDFEGDEELRQMYLNVYRGLILDEMANFSCLADEAISKFPRDQCDINWFKRKVSEMLTFDRLTLVS